MNSNDRWMRTVNERAMNADTNRTRSLEARLLYCKVNSAARTDSPMFFATEFVITKLLKLGSWQFFRPLCDIDLLFDRYPREIPERSRLTDASPRIDQTETRIARHRDSQLSNTSHRVTAENTESGLVMKQRAESTRNKVHACNEPAPGKYTHTVWIMNEYLFLSVLLVFYREFVIKITAQLQPPLRYFPLSVFLDRF